MPYHLSADGLAVLKEDGDPVPGGKHKTKAEALAHLKALEVNVSEAHSERIAFEEKFSAQHFAKPFRILPVGTFHRGERVINITDDVAREIYNNWQKGLPRYGLSVNVEHGADATQPGSVGVIKKISYRPRDGIYADEIEFTGVGKQLLDEERYRAVSPEVIWKINNGAQYQDPKTGAWHDNVLVGLALTTSPFFGQDVAVFSDKFTSPTQHQVHVDAALGGKVAKEDKTKQEGVPAEEAEETPEEEMTEEEKLAMAKKEEASAKTTGGDQKMAEETFAELNQLKEQFAAIAAENKALAEKFNTERTLRRTIEFVEAAEKFSALPAKQEDLGRKLLWMYDADKTEGKENYSYFENLLTQANKVAQSSELFAVKGSAKPGDSEGKDPFIAMVERVQAEKFSTEPYAVGYTKAWDTVSESHKDLAFAYAMTQTHRDNK